MTLCQMETIHRLLNEGYTVEKCDETNGLPIEDQPIGGPTMLRSPEGRLVRVNCDGTVTDFTIMGES